MDWVYVGEGAATHRKTPLFKHIAFNVICGSVISQGFPVERGSLSRASLTDKATRADVVPQVTGRRVERRDSDLGLFRVKHHSGRISGRERQSQTQSIFQAASKFVLCHTGWGKVHELCASAWLELFIPGGEKSTSSVHQLGLSFRRSIVV
jgi:hypothetical protein